MPNITDQDRRAARQWAEDIYELSKDDETPRETRAARVILATVDAPAPTLAEELRVHAKELHYIARKAGETWNASKSDALTRHEVTARNLADRAAQMEQDAEDQQEWNRRITEQTATIARERDEARAEVERLTAVNEELRRTDNYREFKEFLGVQKGAESNAETPDPADVKPGEPWLVECRGERRAAVKDNDPSVPWNTVSANGWFNAENNAAVTLLHRLVPAPRVITNPDELDTLPHNSVILSADNDAWQKSSETNLWASAWWTTSDGEPSMWASCRLCDEDHPVTVLWEPEA